jgi:hypothetical protein
MSAAVVCALLTVGYADIAQGAKAKSAKSGHKTGGSSASEPTTDAATSSADSGAATGTQAAAGKESAADAAAGAPTASTAAEPQPAAAPASDTSAESSNASASASAVNSFDSSMSSTDASAGKLIANWITIGIQQDVVYHSATQDACAVGSKYECFDGSGVYVPLNPGSYAAGGNQVSSAGFLVGTTRVLVGFDRLLTPNISVGLRLGSIFRGKAQRLDTDGAVMIFHGEGRVALWLGDDPFAAAGLRPYLFLSGGIAEADSKILVQYTPTGTNGIYWLDAWKRSGKEFVGAGLGLQVAVEQNHGPFVEARYLQFLSPSVPVVAAQLGYAVGFSD